MDMETPRKTKLYNQIAKDYNPKQAEMQICRYIEGLEARHETRTEELEARIATLENSKAKPAAPKGSAAKPDVPETPAAGSGNQ